MYKSLKSWLNVPIVLKPYATMDSAGDVMYKPNVPVKCAVQHKINQVVTSSGTEEISKTTLYIDGSVAISNKDVIVFDGQEHYVKSVGSFYNEIGVVDLWVVYI